MTNVMQSHEKTDININAYLLYGKVGAPTLAIGIYFGI